MNHPQQIRQTMGRPVQLLGQQPTTEQIQAHQKTQREQAVNQLALSFYSRLAVDLMHDEQGMALNTSELRELAKDCRKAALCYFEEKE